MPEPMPPEGPRVDVLVRLLKENSDELAAILRRYDRYVLKSVISLGLLLALPVTYLAWYVTAPTELMIAGDVVELITLVGMALVSPWVVFEHSRRKRCRVDFDLAAFHLRMVYELASRMEDVGSSLEFWSSYELNMRLAKSQLLLQLVGRRGFPHKDAAAGLRALPQPATGEKRPAASAPIGDLSVATEP